MLFSCQSPSAKENELIIFSPSSALNKEEAQKASILLSKIKHKNISPVLRKDSLEPLGWSALPEEKACAFIDFLKIHKGPAMLLALRGGNGAVNFIQSFFRIYGSLSDDEQEVIKGSIKNKTFAGFSDITYVYTVMNRVFGAKGASAPMINSVHEYSPHYAGSIKNIIKVCEVGYKTTLFLMKVSGADLPSECEVFPANICILQSLLADGYMKNVSSETLFVLEDTPGEFDAFLMEITPILLFAKKHGCNIAFANGIPSNWLERLHVPDGVGVYKVIGHKENEGRIVVDQPGPGHGKNNPLIPVFTKAETSETNTGTMAILQNNPEVAAIKGIDSSVLEKMEFEIQGFDEEIVCADAEDFLSFIASGHKIEQGSLCLSFKKIDDSTRWYAFIRVISSILNRNSVTEIYIVGAPEGLRGLCKKIFGHENRLAFSNKQKGCARLMCAKKSYHKKSEKSDHKIFSVHMDIK